MTFQEVIELRDRLSRELHRQVGLIPELKHSTYFRSIGLPLEEPFVATLRHNHLDNAAAKLTVQSFEVANLKALNRVIPDPLVQLFDSPDLKPGDVLAADGSLTYGQMATPAGLRDVANYADIASPSKAYIIPVQADGTLGAPTSFVRDAHRAGSTWWPIRSATRTIPAAGAADRHQPVGLRPRVRRVPGVLPDGGWTACSPTTPTRRSRRGRSFSSHSAGIPA